MNRVYDNGEVAAANEKDDDVKAQVEGNMTM